MKRDSVARKYFFRAVNSRALYVLLVLTMIGLFAYIFIAQRQMSEYTEKARVSHGLSVQALLLSEENYHTQLEIYEVFSKPNRKRIADFHAHDAELTRRMSATYRAFDENRSELPPEAMAKFQALLTSMPKVRELWLEFIAAVEQKKSHEVQSKLLYALEDKFDAEQFNEKIRDIVILQLNEVERTERKIFELRRYTSFIILLGMAVTVCLTIIMLVLHRAALRGKTNELMLVQAGKLASLGQLSAGMAHELNSPLMFIQGYNGRVRAALTKAGYDPASEVWEHIDEVNQGIARIKGIVEHFREFSRLSHNQLEPVFLNPIIQRSFVLFQEQLRLKDIEVDLQLSSDPLKILADSNRIEQVMLNLISNARDAIAERAEPSSRKITVLTKADQHIVTVQISDTGAGIEPEHISRIFDPFFTTKPVGTGTGLGLSISMGIIRDHHGRMQVESERGRGTTFTLTFPRVDDQKS